MVLINSIMLGNMIKGYLGSKAGNKISGIKNPVLRRGVGKFLAGTGLDVLFPSLESIPRNPEANLLFGARSLSELKLRESIAKQSHQAGAIGESTSGFGTGDQKGIHKSYDWRARLRPKKLGENAVYAIDGETKNNPILAPLVASGGIVFQYTPTIFFTGSADYDQRYLHGSNYPILTYLNSRPPQLPVQTEFTANNQEEAKYMLAVIHALKCLTKSHFGDSALQQGTAGTPPPVLLFEYLGDHGFHKVPVVVLDYNMSFPGDVDYVPVRVGTSNESVTYVPTEIQVTVNLAPNYTPQKVRGKFDIQKLTRGELVGHGFV
mgnify:CR=1 FL=1